MDRNQTEKTQQLDRSVQSEHKLNLEELTTYIYNLLYILKILQNILLHHVQQ